MKTVEIPLGRSGKTALIDVRDEHKVSRHSWHARRGYAAAHVDGATIMMHAMILPRRDGFYTDHVNGNGLDNRRANLRYATPRQNCMNKRVNSNSGTGLKGVRPTAPDRYKVSITVNGKRLWLGTFACPSVAAMRYDAAAQEHFGEFARINGIKNDPAVLCNHCKAHRPTGGHVHWHWANEALFNLGSRLGSHRSSVPL